MPDHAQLLAEIERREQIARTADSPGQHLSISWPRTSGKTALLAFLNENDPTEALRRYAHYRRILADHQPVSITYPLALTICAGCSLPNGRGGWGVGEAFYGLVLFDACRELPGLADALGLGAGHDH